MAEKSRRERQREAARVSQCIDIKQHIAPIYYSLHDDVKAGRHTIYNLPGGRGSCKSSFAGLEIVGGIMEDESGESNAIIFRKVGATLRESVYSQIAWTIGILGVSHLWRGTLSPMQYTYLPTGAQITFRGLDDANKLKSIKPVKGFYKYVWFEEFSELDSPRTVRSVMQSVGRGREDPVVFRTFNPPISKNNWANVCIQEPDKRAVTFQTDYTMIPPEWLGDTFLYEAARLKEINPAAYEYEYLGIPTGTGGEVFPNISIRNIMDDEVENMTYIFQGLDFGFAADPACFIRLSYDRKHETIYLLDEIYERHRSNAWMSEAIKERKYQYWLVTADKAEPKSIADLKDSGLFCTGCTKYPGCVEYRVKWLQHRTLVIDPRRTPNAYREFINYSYPTDKDGILLSVLPDKDNHSIDAVAYALDSVIGKRGSKA